MGDAGRGRGVASSANRAPQDATDASVTGGAAVARSREKKRNSGRPGDETPPRGPKTLRDAHRIATDG